MASRSILYADLILLHCDTPTCKPDLDLDDDGCTDTQDIGDEATEGGQRDLQNYWDFYDVPTGSSFVRDRAVSGLDIFAVIARFNSSDAGPGDFDRFDNPISRPNPVVPGALRANYHPAFDTGSLIGPDPWNLGWAKGSIAATDIFAVLGQFGHSCA